MVWPVIQIDQTVDSQIILYEEVHLQLNNT